MIGFAENRAALYLSFGSSHESIDNKFKNLIIQKFIVYCLENNEQFLTINTKKFKEWLKSNGWSDAK